MMSRLEAVSFAVADARAVATFWARLLDRELLIETSGALVPGEDTQIGLRFVTSATKQAGRPRLHLHLTSRSLADQQRTVERALRLGGRTLDVGQGPDDHHVVLADPGDNELCVIEPANSYLANTGYLGEVTCDGSREVGLFWHRALNWPLVLDKNAQTAVQAPLGGTKISWDSWGEPSAKPKNGGNAQRFELVTTDVTGEAQRLVSLGASQVSVLPSSIELADPDGNEFSLHAH